MEMENQMWRWEETAGHIFPSTEIQASPAAFLSHRGLTFPLLPDRDKVSRSSILISTANRTSPLYTGQATVCGCCGIPAPVPAAFRLPRELASALPHNRIS